MSSAKRGRPCKKAVKPRTKQRVQRPEPETMENTGQPTEITIAEPLQCDATEPQPQEKGMT